MTKSTTAWTWFENGKPLLHKIKKHKMDAVLSCPSYKEVKKVRISWDD